MAKASHPVHPGEHLLANYLSSLGLSVAQVAEALSIPEQQLTEVLTARIPVTLDLAQRLAYVVGSTAEHWLALQCAYDVAHASPLTVGHLKRLESTHWGQPVAAFFQEVPWHQDATTSCLVTCAFAQTGQPMFILTQPRRTQAPSITNCFEHHAMACINVMKTGPDPAAVVFENKEGFAYFRARCEQARKAAIDQQQKTLAGVSQAGGLQWVAHYLEGTSSMGGEMATVVKFGHENTPCFTSHRSGNELLEVLDARVRDLTRMHAGR
jgi:antitoxin HigA-1